MLIIFLFTLNYAANRFGQCAPEPKIFELLILHNNDMHSRFEETSKRSSACKDVDREKNECYGGFARTAHLVRKARQAALDGTGPNTIFLNAGDTFTGTQWFSVHKSKIVSEFLNILQPDAMSFGNHEFDLSVPGILPVIEAANFPIVAANLDFSKEPELLETNVTKSVVIIVSGVKIGVIGYLTPETRQISSPRNIIFNDEVESIKAESERLHKAGVKIIIALGHSGILTDTKIGKEVPLVDIVIGGHSNTFLWNGEKPDLEQPYGPYPLLVQQSTGKTVCVAQAYAYTKYMGYMNVKFNKDGDVISCEGQPILVDYHIPQDDDVLQVLEKYRPEVLELDRQVLGKSAVVLDGSVESCRFKECNFGNLITDAFVTYHASKYSGKEWTDTPIAIINGGAIRNSIEPISKHNNITRGELLSVMPFGDSLIAVTIKGEDLLRALEIGARSNGETSRGELLQTSGLRVVYDLSKQVGSRVVKASARCSSCRVPTYEPIGNKKDYRIIITTFLYDGGDGHKIFKDKGFDFFTADQVDIDVVAWYMTKFSPVCPEESERMIVLNSDVAIGKSEASCIRSTSSTALLVASIYFITRY